MSDGGRKRDGETDAPVNRHLLSNTGKSGAARDLDDVSSLKRALEVAEMEMASRDDALRGMTEALKQKNDELAMVKREAAEALEIMWNSQRVAKIGAWWVSMPSRQLGWTRETFRIFGMSPDDEPPTLTSFVEWVHPADRELVIAKIEEQLNPFDGTVTYSYRIVLPDGSVKHLEHIGRQQYNEEGELLRIIGTIQDITERKASERALVESEAKCRSYIESAPVGIFTVDERGVFLNVNSAGAHLTEYAVDELLGMPFTAIVAPEDTARAIEDFEKALTLGKTSGEIHVITKSGAVRVVIVDVIKISESLVLGFVNDMTEYRQMEKLLRHAEKMQAVGQLADGIAHDFNNQLSGILGYADMLGEEGEKHPVVARYAERIISAVKRASELTSALLAFSRKSKYLNAEVDVHRIVSKVVKLLEHSIDKKIAIKQALRADSPTIKGDPDQLQNAVLNLALNARDAMPDGGEMTFSTETCRIEKNDIERRQLDVSPGHYLNISVTDTGVGMDAATQQRIFEPFYSTKKESEGAGMGLAAVYGTVKSHGGAIELDSEQGKGTRFDLYLPLSPAGGASAGVDAARGEEASTGNGHILLIDDEKLIRDVGGQLLERLGYTASICANGNDAVAFYKTEWRTVDLVILDVIMPEMDGEETFSALRSINPDVVVLVSSGHIVEGKAQRIIENGAKGFIQKPYRKAELSQKLSELLG